MHPEDPRAVHYAIPCEAARGGSYLYAYHYFGVNCDACLDNRTPPTLNWDNTPKALKIVSWILYIPLATLAVLLTFMMFRQGYAAIGLLIGIPTAFMVASPLYNPLSKIVKPLASKIMARRYNQPRK